MIVKKNDTSHSRGEKPRGGEGFINAFSYLKDEELTNSMKGFNVMSLEVGASIGYHQHVSDEEIYFIISGKGLVKDNDTEMEVSTGDLIYTKDGEFHGMKNIGDEELNFVAFIVGV